MPEYPARPQKAAANVDKAEADPEALRGSVACDSGSERGWRGFALRGAMCLIGFLSGVVLLILSAEPGTADPSWSTPLGQLGLALCITSVLYFIFQQVFDRTNQEHVERVVRGAVGSLDGKIQRVDASLDELLTHNKILAGAFDSGVVCIYSRRSDGLADVMTDIRQSERVRLLGISLREYFMNAGRYSGEMDVVMTNTKNTEGRSLEALILDPNGDQATIRAERESDAPFSVDNPYERSGLYADVQQTMQNLNMRYVPNKIEGRVYSGAPCAFMVITDTHTYIEQYHYGLPKSGLVGGSFPLLKFPSDSQVAKHLEGHFTYIWENHSRPLVDLLVKREVGVSKNAWECQLMNLYPSRSEAEDRIAYILANASGEVGMLGISLRDFFHGGRRFYKILASRDSSAKARQIRALLLNPESDQGRIRSEREEPGTRPDNLNNDVLTSLNTIERLDTTPDSVDARLYHGAPCCFMVLSEYGVLIEQYHYGSDEPGSTILGGKVPVLEYAPGSQAYREFSGHFEFLWGSKGPSTEAQEWMVDSARAGGAR